MKNGHVLCRFFLERHGVVPNYPKISLTQGTTSVSFRRAPHSSVISLKEAWSSVQHKERRLEAFCFQPSFEKILLLYTYLFLNTGLRFSAKAVQPSLKSSEDQART